MSNYSLLLDVAKVRQEELTREFEVTRKAHILRTNRKSISLAKKLRTFLATMI